MKKISLNSILTALCALGMAVIATVTGFMIAGLDTANASVVFEESSKNSLYSRYFVGGANNGRTQTGGGEALFSKDGINDDLAIALINVIKSVKATPKTEYTAADFSNYAIQGTSIEQGAVYLRLFAPLSGTTSMANFTKSPHNDLGTKNDARWWRAVYLKDDVLTLWMADGYRNSVYGKDGWNSFDYEGCEAHKTLMTDFSGLLSQYDTGADAITEIIVRNNNPYKGLGGGGTGDKYTYNNTAVPENDYIWLPSAYEVLENLNDGVNRNTNIAYSTDRSGQWKLNGFDRAFNGTSSGTDSRAWLRSNAIYNTWTGAYLHVGGTVGGTYASESCALRPAIHISITTLARAVISAEVEIG